MQTIKRNYVRILAVVLAVVIAVSTPISDFADTQGIHETEAASAATVITIAKLFGALAGAYGLYVATDKLSDMAEGWFNWTADNATDARTDLEKIKQGVTSYVVSKALSDSVAGYLGTLENSSIELSLNGRADTSNYFEKNQSEQLYNEWKLFFNSDSRYQSNDSLYYPFIVNWSPATYYESGGLWNVVSMKKSEIDKITSLPNFHSSIIYSLSGTSYPSFIFVGFDSEGKEIGFYNPNKMYNVQRFGISNGSVVRFAGNDEFSTSTGYDNFVQSDYETLYPIYRTTFLTHNSARTLQDYIDNSVYGVTMEVDYKVHGNNALDNTDALTDQEVDEEKLVHIYDVNSEAYQKYLESLNNNDNDEEPDTQALANAITLAVLSALQNMGYIENPTDEPSGENVKEQLGNIQISLDGLIDAISQINPAQGLANIAQGIAELPQKITASVTDAIRNVFEDLFVPDEGAIQDKVDEITDKFSFADSLLTVVDDIDGALKNASGPPEIYIHFEEAEDSKYTPIGTLKLLSFEWYERYKPYGDALLSSMLWLFFLWKVRKRIAEIVQGLSVSGESDANASANSAIGIERGRSS